MRLFSGLLIAANGEKRRKRVGLHVHSIQWRGRFPAAVGGEDWDIRVHFGTRGKAYRDWISMEHTG